MFASPELFPSPSFRRKQESMKFQPYFLDSGFHRNDEMNFMAIQQIWQKNQENP
jgi:hypothetical protein